MSAHRFRFTLWRFGVTFPGLGFWIGAPRYVMRGHGFQTWWRPFGRWSHTPGVGTSPFGFVREKP